MKVICDGSGDQFSPDVVRHFRAVVMPYPVGHEIELPDGRTGVVVSVDPESPDSPTVRARSETGIEQFTVDMAAAASAAA